MNDFEKSMRQVVKIASEYAMPSTDIDTIKQLAKSTAILRGHTKTHPTEDMMVYYTEELYEGDRNNMKIYLASPFFNDEELKHVSILEDVLRAKNMTVFSPRENQLPEFELGGYEWRTNVFRNDIHHIMWADAVVAIIGDNYDDTGTAWEIGYAYAMGKPVYLYNPTGNIINLMITDSTHGYFESVTEIIDYDFDTAPIKPYMGEVK